MNRKEILARVLYYSGILFIFGWIRSLLVSEIRILAYHRILEHWSETEHPGDLDLISASTKQFKWQIKHLNKHFNVIGINELVSYFNTGKKLPKKAVVITFDDGFADNYLYAFPILKKYTTSATIFISVDCIEKKETFWFERLSEQIKLLKGRTIYFTSIDKNIEFPSERESQGETTYELLKLLKQANNDIRKKFMEEINSLFRGTSLEVDELSQPMTWSQVKEMSQNQIFFGSHGTDHSILTKLSDFELEQQLIKSKKEIESRIGNTCNTISYPVGGNDAFNKKVINDAISSGYKLGLTYLPGTNLLSSSNPLFLKRIHVERYLTNAWFAASLTFPNFFP